uniref:Sodium/potassium-transporting ATPase subunit beta-1-like n=1 Tax=Saccoglossus kowalevskii TaxID=10224 RepID=A0ABM0M8X7_SACKO|nr:PREDICTED: sodium/potassium-transporting ATPase subunit beta-1-like [Saccoglossus kowalevskii]
MADKKVGEYHQEDDKTCMQNVADQWHGFTSFMWDPEHKAVMGRNARSWAEIGVFYLFFYAFLAGFFAAMFSVFYIGFISHEEPTYTDKLGTPGLAHRPKYSNEENIAFNMDNPNTYNKFVDDIVKLLDGEQKYFTTC